MKKLIKTTWLFNLCAYLDLIKIKSELKNDYSSKGPRWALIFFYIYLFMYLFIYFFWLRWVFVAARGLSLVAASRGHSSLQCTGLSLQWPLLLQSTGSRHAGLSSCGTWAQQFWHVSSRAQAQQLWCTGLAAPRHAGSSRTRDRTRVPCIGRRILNHCATREVPGPSFLSFNQF